jgi:CBS domain-containing protein
MFKATDVMTTTVVSVSPHATMKEAAALLLRHRVSGVPVVDDAGRIVGVISEFDLLKLVYSPEVESHRVGDYMSTKLLTAAPDDSLIEIVDTFTSHPIRRLPVVSEGKLVGLISRHDLIRFALMTRDRVHTTQRERLATVGGSDRK